MKGKLLAILFLAGSSLLAQPRVFVGAGIGYRAPAAVVAYGPPPPPPVAYIAPRPGPGYTWVGGYYYPVGPRWGWRAGYWARPRVARAYWVAPRYHARRYYPGYWRR
jgi:hypothetical protein